MREKSGTQEAPYKKTDSILNLGWQKQPEFYKIKNV